MDPLIGVKHGILKGQLGRARALATMAILETCMQCAHSTVVDRLRAQLTQARHTGMGKLTGAVTWP